MNLADSMDKGVRGGGGRRMEDKKHGKDNIPWGERKPIRPEEGKCNWSRREERKHGSEMRYRQEKRDGEEKRAGEERRREEKKRREDKRPGEEKRRELERRRGLEKRRKES
jgi:hypothetical protein